MNVTQTLELPRAMRIGADALKARYPAPHCDVIVRYEGDLHDAHAQWVWPGIVRVTLRYTGKFVVESMPGKPYTLNPKACE